jgi:Na+:H+ antiporter, NhaA family
MAGPALVYVACNWDDTEALRGWAIPMATDIAFALGVLALLGSRAPPSLKIFLLALAIIDDLGAIIIIAGVIVGVAMPLNAADGSSPARDLEHALHPWIAFGVLPAFAFANAGLSLTDIGLSDLLHPIQLGIGLGLFIGKQLGVIVSIWIATRAGLATLPEGTDWRHIYGVALLTGTGFTNESVYGHARLSGRGL